MIQRGSQEEGEVEGSKRIVVLGGTFSQIHEGHLALLKKALSISKELKIGLVENPKGKIIEEKIESFEDRKSNLLKEIRRISKDAKIEIVAINDPYGPSTILSELTDIVCTEETLPRTLAINKIRETRGLKKLKVNVVGLINAEDGRPIRSSRIRLGEIDRKGNLLSKEIKILYD